MATTDRDVRGTVRSIVAEYTAVEVDGLPDGEDLFGAGMTSQGSVAVMVAVEDAFDIAFPDAMLTRATFTSVDSITAAIQSLLAGD